jgi:hypothetical protein
MPSINSPKPSSTAGLNRTVGKGKSPPATRAATVTAAVKKLASVSMNNVKPPSLSASVQVGSDSVPRFRPPENPVWSPYRDGVSSSVLNLFTMCREQVRINYVEGWKSRNPAYYFEFGTCAHWMLEQCYRGRYLPSSFAKVDWRDLSTEYDKRIWVPANPMPTQKQTEDQRRIYRTLELMMPSYWARWDGDMNGGKYSMGNTTAPPVKWEHLEQQFNVPYRYPAEPGKVATPNIDAMPLVGRRDGVFRDKVGKLWVLDTKCKSVINHEDIMSTLQFDLQQMFYAYVTQIEFGEPVEGIIMNIIRRPALRQKKTEDLDQLIERTGEDVAARMDEYFCRYQMKFKPGEVDKWAASTLAALMHEMREWWEGRSAHYMNPNALTTKYGKADAYDMIVNGSVGMYARRKRAHPELEAA